MRRKDGQTDGQNYDSQDRARIARAVKTDECQVCSDRLTQLTYMHTHTRTHARTHARGVCGRGVGSNSMQCTSCHRWLTQEVLRYKGKHAQSDEVIYF